VQFLNAVLLSFAFGQVGLLLHDHGHQQVYSKSWVNTILGYVFAFIIGVSLPWWNSKHNAHHISPNHLERDPDFLPFFAYTEEQALSKKNFISRSFVKHQGWFIIPMQCTLMFGFLISCVEYLMRQKFRRQLLEFSLLTAHFALYFGLVFLTLGIWRGIFFVAVHYLVWGFYMGMAFA
jgi:fatty acid desaturase